MIIPLLIIAITAALWIGCVIANLIADRKPASRPRTSRLAPRASDCQHARELEVRNRIFARLGPPFNKPKANGNTPHHGRQSTKTD